MAQTVTNTLSLADYKASRTAVVKNSDGTEVVYDLCVPSVTQVSRKGRLEVVFNREIVPLTEEDMFKIENAGVLQF